MVGAAAHGGEPEGGIGEGARGYLAQEMLGQDGRCGAVEEAGRGCAQRERDGAVVGSGDLHARPVGGEGGQTSEAGVLDQGDGEGDIARGERRAVVPEEGRLQGEG